MEQDELLDRVYAGKKDFTESELKDLAIEYQEFDKIEGDDRRWSKTISTILQIKDKYFKIDWEQGLTENQEHEFYNQPVEVEFSEREETIIVRDYTEKK